MSESWAQIIIQVLVGGSFAVMTFVLKDLKDQLQEFKDQLKENSGELKRNTEEQSKLNTKLEIMAIKVEAVEREMIKTLTDMQGKISDLEQESLAAGERFRGVEGAVSTLWGMARVSGWALPADYPGMLPRIR